MGYLHHFFSMCTSFAICWKDYPFSIELPWRLFENQLAICLWAVLFMFFIFFVLLHFDILETFLAGEGLPVPGLDNSYRKGSMDSVSLICELNIPAPYLLCLRSPASQYQATGDRSQPRVLWNHSLQPVLDSLPCLALPFLRNLTKVSWPSFPLAPAFCLLTSMRLPWNPVCQSRPPVSGTEYDQFCFPVLCWGCTWILQRRTQNRTCLDSILLIAWCVHPNTSTALSSLQ